MLTFRLLRSNLNLILVILCCASHLVLYTKTAIRGFIMHSLQRLQWGGTEQCHYPYAVLEKKSFWMVLKQIIISIYKNVFHESYMLQDLNIKSVHWSCTRLDTVYFTGCFIYSWVKCQIFVVLRWTVWKEEKRQRVDAENQKFCKYGWRKVSSRVSFGGFNRWTCGTWFNLYSWKFFQS